MQHPPPLRLAVSGIPRGLQAPRPDGNWLTSEQRQRILSLSPRIELLEIPAHQVGDVAGIEIVLAEGGNRVHYPGELDRKDYARFFTPSLRWVQLCSTGFSDNIMPQIRAGQVALTNAPGLHTIPIAESVLAAMLDHAKRFRRRRLLQRQRAWRSVNAAELNRQTVLILGMGRIGQRVGALCHAFGMHVIGLRRRAQPTPGADKVITVAGLDQYLPQADYVVVALPLTPETVHILGAAQLQKLKADAYLINVGRGKNVDESALLHLLQSGAIAGAYLDVFEEEPLPAGHPFWGLENVLFVPHDSHSSPNIGERMVDIFCANLRRYIKQEPLHNICDPDRGY